MKTIIELRMIQNQKSIKELQSIEDNFGKIVNIKYLNETQFSLGKEELEFEIEIELKDDLSEISTIDENSFMLETFSHKVYFNYDPELHEFDLSTYLLSYEPRIYDEKYKNQKTVKTAKSVISYIERF